MKIMLTIGAVLIASAGQAQPITAPVETVVMTREARTRATYESASMVIQEGTDNICVKDTMTDQEASDVRNQFVWVLQLSTDDFVSVLPGAGSREEWTGGTFFNRFTGQDEPKHIRTCWTNTALQSGQYVGARARVHLDLTVGATVGFRLRLNPVGSGTPD